MLSRGIIFAIAKNKERKIMLGYEAIKLYYRCANIFFLCNSLKSKLKKNSLQSNSK